MCVWGTRPGRCVNGQRFTALVVTQRSDSIEQLEPVTDCSDAELLQDLVRQARQDRLVNLILAECRLILPEAQAPQPDHDVHNERPRLSYREENRTIRSWYRLCLRLRRGAIERDGRTRAKSPTERRPLP